MGARRHRLSRHPLSHRHLQRKACDDGGVLRLPEGRPAPARHPADPRRRPVSQPRRGDHQRQTRLCQRLAQLGRQQDDLRRWQDLRRPQHRLGRSRRHAPAPAQQDQPLRRRHDARRLHARCRRFSAQRQLVPRRAQRPSGPHLPRATARSRPGQARRHGALHGGTPHHDGHGDRRPRESGRAFLRRFG